MEQIIEVWNSILRGDADRKKIWLLIFLVCAAVMVLFSFELLTASFTLNRLQKSADLVSKLQEIQSAMTTNSSPELVRNFKILSQQTEQAINSGLNPIDCMAFLKNQMHQDFIFKFAAGMAIWVMLWIILLIDLWRREKSLRGIYRETKGLIQIGFWSGFFTMLMPKVYWPFHSWLLFHVLIYPFLAFACFMILIFLFFGKATDKPVK